MKKNILAASLLISFNHCSTLANTESTLPALPKKNEGGLTNIFKLFKSEGNENPIINELKIKIKLETKEQLIESYKSNIYKNQLKK